MGFFTDAYDLFCISLVTKLLGRIYYHRDGSPKPGIGGDYPLSATIMSEYTNKKTRGAFIAAVFAMQGFGILVGGILVAIVVSVLFNAGYPSPAFQHNAVASTVPEADHAWRVILILGVLPALLTYYWRHPNKTDSSSPPGIGVRNSLIVLESDEITTAISKGS
uniref:PT1 n=1 Tax=Solanum tuberosum TaxID=4113 RepID=M1B1F5_SOLTU